MASVPTTGNTESEDLIIVLNFFSLPFLFIGHSKIKISFIQHDFKPLQLPLRYDSLEKDKERTENDKERTAQQLHDVCQERLKISSTASAITLHPTSLIQFTQRKDATLNHLQVYDVNMKSPVCSKEEYDLIFGKFQEVVKKSEEIQRCLLILGNSGIGKSVGLDDLLRRVLESADCFGYLLIIVVAVKGDYILFRKTIKEEWGAYNCKHQDAKNACDALLEQIPGEDDKKKVLLLHDVKSTERNTLQFDAPFAASLRSSYCLTLVVSSSPKKANSRNTRRVRW